MASSPAVFCFQGNLFLQCSCRIAPVFSRTNLLLVMVNSYCLQSQLLPAGILLLLFVSQVPNHMVVWPWKWRQGGGFSTEKWSLHGDQQFWHEKLIQKNMVSSTAISTFNKANVIKVIKTKTRFRLWKLLCKIQSCATCAGRAFVIPVSGGERNGAVCNWCILMCDLDTCVTNNKSLRQHVFWRIFEVRLEEQSTEKQNPWLYCNKNKH